ncbi:MAG: hypothetical protein WKF80_04390 [Thermomicrobiales bacterium]
MPTPTHPETPTDIERDVAVEGQILTLRRRFADRLTGAEWEAVRTAITEQRQHAAAVRAVPLRNGDEPATVFSSLAPDSVHE